LPRQNEVQVREWPARTPRICVQRCIAFRCTATPCGRVTLFNATAGTTGQPCAWQLSHASLSLLRAPYALLVPAKVPPYAHRCAFFAARLVVGLAAVHRAAGDALPPQAGRRRAEGVGVGGTLANLQVSRVGGESGRFGRQDGGIGRAGGGKGKVSPRRRFPQASGDLRVRWCSAVLKIDVMLL